VQKAWGSVRGELPSPHDFLNKTLVGRPEAEGSVGGQGAQRVRVVNVPRWAFFGVAAQAGGDEKDDEEGDDGDDDGRGGR
jgi:hypothetical protein